MAKVNDPISEYHLNKNQPEKPQFAVYKLGEYIGKNIPHTTRPHIHSYYQIIWFQTGAGCHFVDFKAYDVTRDTIFFIAKNQVHYFDANLDYDGYLLHFNEPFLVHTDSDVEFFLKCNFFKNSYQSPACYIDQTIRPMLQVYLSQIQDELADNRSLGKEELLRGYLKAFLIQVQRFRNSSEEPAFAADEKRLQLLKFIHLVDENYQKGLTMGEYAALMHISSRTLSDITNQLLSKTPLMVVQERVVLEAQRLLLHSELNVNQIGFRLGFDDPSYFVKYFKKSTGMSPSEFRKSIS